MARSHRDESRANYKLGDADKGGLLPVRES